MCESEREWGRDTQRDIHSFLSQEFNNLMCFSQFGDIRVIFVMIGSIEIRLVAMANQET